MAHSRWDIESWWNERINEIRSELEDCDSDDLKGFQNLLQQLKQLKAKFFNEISFSNRKRGENV